jgi:hypothetical protein
MMIRKAERRQAKLRLGISGASGSGKTWSALEIATGMGGKIGMIDTEAGRGELYGNDFEYDIIRLEAPYSVERYIEAIKMFEKAGYDILIIDSLSHAWVGEGGVLSVVDKAGNNSFTQGWKAGTPKHNSLIEAMVTSSLHIITTLRVKTEYVVEKNDRGKAEPRKIGLSPVQRDGLEYEFTVFMDISQEHTAHVTKDNTQLFDQQYLKPSKAMGEKLISWLNEGLDSEEEFVNVTLPSLITEIDSCEDLNSLRLKFSELYHLYSTEFPDRIETLVAAKDKRKEELLSEESDFVTPVIKTGFKNSQALVQGVA